MSTDKDREWISERMTKLYNGMRNGAFDNINFAVREMLEEAIRYGKDAYKAKIAETIMDSAPELTELLLQWEQRGRLAGLEEAAKIAQDSGSAYAMDLIRKKIRAQAASEAGTEDKEG